MRVWPNYYVASDLRDEISYLKNWIKDRLDWMDEQLEYYSRHPRGDADGDENVNISDATVILDYLLTGNSDGVDLTAGDCNLDGNCDIQDVMLLIDYALNGTWHY
ncbi:MAG: dockerin type I repeat-containing protein [Muribaculaceae bacterium]|nr:dockerin type I repeat-containing protein [Muribaculaceae bacterium]